MADTDPAATLHALADYFRKYDEVTTLGGVIAPEFAALAEHVDLMARLQDKDPRSYPSAIPVLTRSLLAVAAAAGVTP